MVLAVAVAHNGVAAVLLILVVMIKYRVGLARDFAKSGTKPGSKPSENPSGL